MNDSNSSDEISEDWEEWDGRSPFWIHCVAGSIAGVTEHTLVYPLDTVRTHIQVCAACLHRPNTTTGPKSSMFAAEKSSLLRSTVAKPPSTATHLPVGMWQTIRHLVNEPALAASPQHHQPQMLSLGWSRLWVGVQTMLIGCIPAHALYFSAYESVKATIPDHPAAAGAAATACHDVVMTPLDTIKQRMQLGHYQGSLRTAVHNIVTHEGTGALYRSFPVTVATNLPYGMVMVSVHEWCKEEIARQYTNSNHYSGSTMPQWQIVLTASSIGGFVAATVTTPLDRIKTCLQTQALAPACLKRKASSSSCPRYYASWSEAAVSIAKTEGLVGFFRGWMPRVLSHTPAVAISWTTYETTRNYLLEQFCYKKKT